jgi:hypothetical protein
MPDHASTDTGPGRLGPPVRRHGNRQHSRSRDTPVAAPGGVRRGERFVIAKAGRPIARVIAIEPAGAGDPDRLSDGVRQMLEAPDDLPWFNAANPWEITIKHGLGRADCRVDPHALRRGLQENGYEEFAITGPTPRRRPVCQRSTRIPSTGFWPHGRSTRARSCSPRTKPLRATRDRSGDSEAVPRQRLSSSPRDGSALPPSTCW